MTPPKLSTPATPGATPITPAAPPTPKDLLDWSESIICNCKPMHEVTEAEWSDIVKKWRDQKHEMFPDRLPAHPEPARGDWAEAAHGNNPWHDEAHVALRDFLQRLPPDERVLCKQSHKIAFVAGYTSARQHARPAVDEAKLREALIAAVNAGLAANEILATGRESCFSRAFIDRILTALRPLIGQGGDK